MVPWRGIRAGVSFGLSERVEKNFRDSRARPQGRPRKTNRIDHVAFTFVALAFGALPPN